MTHKVFMVMGVSGSGKTTIGKLLAQKLNIDFFDGDSFHSVANIEKMSAGIPLTDEDRKGWLESIHTFSKQSIQNSKSIVFACSALKEIYRTLLSKGIESSIEWIYLKGDADIITERMKNRVGHFMSAEMLQSQMSILEEPSEGIVITIEDKPENIIHTIMEQLSKSDFGVVGLGVMGKSLARNFANKGVSLSLFNRHVAGKEEQVAQKSIEVYPELKLAKGFEDVTHFVQSLKKPRKIFLMIKAGEETDVFIESIRDHLDAGDILIDGGNSHYLETKRRIASLKNNQIYFIGAGVSGGEKGALEGPSIMPSGNSDSYKLVEPYLNRIAAKDKKGNPCCTYIGAEGSGHFVKMVHNGIEYAEMQLIAEVYAYLRFVSKMSPAEISSVFSEWNKGELNSYLLEITASLLLKKEGEEWLIDLILDKAGNKGTGNWTTIAASELGQPATLITAALFARYVSTIKDEINIRGAQIVVETEASIVLDEIKSAYFLARIVNHQQGFSLIQAASKIYTWNLNLSEIARIWTNGCIIRSAFMEQLIEVLKVDGNLFSHKEILTQAIVLKSALKNFGISSLSSDLPIPCHLAALDSFNALRSSYASANIIQAQRDYFGAHTYQKVGDVSGAFYHTEW
jgi:6-phosphogluconate dehydrogenase